MIRQAFQKVSGLVMNAGSINELCTAARWVVTAKQLCSVVTWLWSPGRGLAEKWLSLKGKSFERLHSVRSLGFTFEQG